MLLGTVLALTRPAAAAEPAAEPTALRDALDRAQRAEAQLAKLTAGLASGGVASGGGASGGVASGGVASGGIASSSGTGSAASGSALGADSNCSSAAASRAPPSAPSSRSSWPPPRSDGFSSFECTGGSQAFARNYSTQRTQEPIAQRAESTFLRLCLLRDVCFAPSGELQFFVDPGLEAATPPHLSVRAFSAERGGLAMLDYFSVQFGGLVRTPGALYDAAFAPTVVEGPRPPGLPFFEGSGAAVHALGRLSFANNWGHLLVDTVLPALAAAEVFGFGAGEVQPLDYYTCATMVGAGTQLPFVPGAVHADLCRTNIARWLAPLFSHPLLHRPDFEGRCFRQLLVGHGGALSLKSLWHHRAATIRAARERLHAALAVPQPPLREHRILVLEKTAQANGALLPGLCPIVRLAAARLRHNGSGGGGGGGAVAVDCAEPTPLGAAEQLALLGAATLVVCENGSTGYAALFQRPGSALLAVLGDAEGEAKEVQVLLSLTDVLVLYSSHADFKEMGPGTLLVALERVGKRLGLPHAALAAE